MKQDTRTGSARQAINHQQYPAPTDSTSKPSGYYYSNENGSYCYRSPYGSKYYTKSRGGPRYASVDGTAWEKQLFANRKVSRAGSSNSSFNGSSYSSSNGSSNGSFDGSANNSNTVGVVDSPHYFGDGARDQMATAPKTPNGVRARDYAYFQLEMPSTVADKAHAYHGSSRGGYDRGHGGEANYADGYDDDYLWMATRLKGSSALMRSGS